MFEMQNNTELIGCCEKPLKIAETDWKTEDRQDPEDAEKWKDWSH